MAHVKNLWRGKKVLITGHTGFKGYWLSLLLHRLGANVTGLSLMPNKKNKLYLEGNLSNYMTQEIFGDICDVEFITGVFNQNEFDYVFHLAAQSLVIDSFLKPFETLSTNIMGTANVLKSALSQKNLCGVALVTTDKVYKNNEWEWAYRETDDLGGDDVYSASKAAAELITPAIIKSFNQHGIPVATLRAGNVVGGGDWADRRLIPDIFRAIQDQDSLKIRNPNATRPWQYILDCLVGYLLVAEKQILRQSELFDSFNFGPEDAVSVEEVVSIIQELNDDKNLVVEKVKIEFPEHRALRLDSSIARKRLQWRPRFTSRESIAETAEWYIRYLKGEDSNKLSIQMIERYLDGQVSL